MASVGLLCHLYFGEKPDGSRVRKIIDHLRQHPPNLKALREVKLHTNYYWYYATLALFMVGGDDWYWWNEQLRDLVVGLQCRSGCAEGSWNPDDGWMAPYGGRLYATCLNLLSLEVYYRYLPLYRSHGELPFLEKGGAKGASASPPPDSIALAGDPLVSSGRRLEAIRALGNMKGEEARVALERILTDSNAAIRWQAIKSIGARGDRKSVTALLKVLTTAGDDLLPTIVKALGQLGGQPALRALVPYLTHGEERVRTRALQALRSATGKREGMNPERWEEIVEKGDFR